MYFSYLEGIVGLRNREIRKLIIGAQKLGMHALAS